jgi:hypothetical protein
MSFKLKSTSFRPKTSEQMKIRYVLKLCPKTRGKKQKNSAWFCTHPRRTLPKVYPCKVPTLKQTLVPLSNFYLQRLPRNRMAKWISNADFLPSLGKLLIQNQSYLLIGLSDLVE